MLVLRTDLSGDPAFRTLLSRAREVALKAYAHQDLPFEQLVEELRPARDLSHTPLFQALFVLQNAPVPALELGGLGLSPIQAERGTARLDLGLSINETQDGLIGLWEYSTDLFDDATIGRMQGHFQTLLAGIAADPDLRLADLPLLTEAERRQLLVEWNATRGAFRRQASGVRRDIADSRLLAPDSWCIHHLFEAQVACRPDAVAVVFDRRPPTDNRHPVSLQMTYRELNARANQLAQHLRGMGVGPEVPVGLYVERSLELVLGLLGTLKAGGAYVPLDPTYPQERLAFMLQDADVPVLLIATSDDQRQETGGRRQETGSAPDNIIQKPKPKIQSRQMLDLVADWPQIARACPDNPSSAVTPDNLAYVIYTSGSTGHPKGVLAHHRGVCNLAAAETSAYDVRPDDRLLLFPSFSFDAAASVIFGALTTGGMLCLTPQDALVPGPGLIRLLDDQAITFLEIPPSALAALPFAALPALRGILVGSEPCPADVVAEWGAGRRFFNAYGPTETTVMTTIAAYAGDRRGMPLGRPIANTQVYLLDRRLHPVAIGVPGELYIGGMGLTRGYLNRPDLTAAVFVPNPFAQESEDAGRRTQDERRRASAGVALIQNGGRLYRTGDLARYLPDGNIEFLGRVDHQVKIRGFRIEPGEVETILGQHPALREAAVLAREDALGDMRLVAYVVPTADERPKTKDQRPMLNDDSDPSPLVRGPSSLISELRAFLKEKLPNYMAPTAFVLLEALPRSPNGKVDRRALPAPDATRPTLDSSFAAPRTPVEELLASLWAGVLRLEQVGVHDNFFELGGHSLLATQLIARAEEAFRVELPLRALFEAPTVAALAERIAGARRAAVGATPPPLRPIPRDRPLPLSFAQQRLWFLDQLQSASALYAMPAALRLIGTLDMAALKRSLNAIVERHETLRTTFPAAGGQPAQVIAPAWAGAATAPLQMIDLQSLPADVREVAARQLAMQDAQRPFDLSRGPLLRATLLRSSAQEHVLLLNMHHIVSDGWSMGVFIRESAALYAAFVSGQPSPLPPLSIQYADYAVWQRTWLLGEDEHGDQETGDETHISKLPESTSSPFQTHLAYWRQHLADLSALQLPTDHPRPPLPSFQGAHRDIMLPKELSDGLLARSQREGMTLFMTLLAAWQAVLARYSGQDDIAVGSPIANRTQAATEDLIGCFVNTLVLRTDLSGHPTAQNLLQRVREVCLDAYAHQDLPFEAVVEALQPDRDLSRHPLFQVMLTLQNAPIPDLELPDLTFTVPQVEYGTVKFDLNLTLAETPVGIAGTLSYATDLYDGATIARMAGHFQTLLGGIVAHPTEPLSTLSLLTEYEHHQLLVEWNATTVAYPTDTCLHHLVEAQAARTPDAVAIVFDGQPSQRQGDRRQATGEGAQYAVLSPEHLTYEALDRHANQLAHVLLRHGAAPDTPIGLCIERSPALAVGLLAILKAGAAVLPLDPAYPPARLAAMLDQAQPSALLTAQEQKAKHKAQSTPDTDWFLVPGSRFSGWVVDLVADWPTIAQERTAPPATHVQPDHLAYVLFTSGSTGTPKGVLLPHCGLCNRLRWGQDAYQLTPGDVLFQKASFSFDAAIWETFWPLMTGARLVLARPGGQQDSAYLVEALQRERVTVVHFVPAMLRVFVEEPGVADCTDLRRLYCGGEALPGALVERCRARLGVTLHNQYGPTETSVNTSFWTYAGGDAPAVAPIGRPIANMRLYVLDRALQPVPIGVAGELYIAGVGLARGYLGSPELTAERFIPNPFVGDTEIQVSSIDYRPSALGYRLYRTGDLVRYRADRTIEILGRADQQVKLRGFRIELGEIEAVLRQHAAVRACVVRASEDAPGDTRLVAYVVASDELRATSRPDSTTDDRRQTTDDGEYSSIVHRPSSLIPALRAFLKEKLPDYMVPSAFVLLNALPLLPNGKVNRRALPPPDQVNLARKAAVAAPRTELEALLAQIWADVLGLDVVGVHDDFFMLGGHSLMATQAIARVRAAFQVELPLRTLFETPTVAGLAARIMGARRVEGARPAPPIRPVPRTGRCRSRSHSSGCGFSISSRWATRPTTCRRPCGCGGGWTAGRWRGA
jgi:amino acid adenylation domain-containing protein